MKTQIILAGIIAVLISACSKSNVSGSDDAVTFQVYETGTNTPVGGASIKLKRCTNYDFEFGCQAVGVFATYTTGSNGTAVIKSQDYNRSNEGIMIEKIGYWPQAGSQGRNDISAEGVITATIKKTNDYPDDALFFLFVADQNRRVTSGIKVAATTLHDTTVTFKAFGAQANHISWVVGREYIVPGWNSFYTVYDTVAVKELSPVNVVKGSTTTINIEY